MISGLTQAAVSGHMRCLEESLGFALFDRTGRSATHNAAGLRTLARTEALVAGFDALGEPTQDEEWVKPLEIGAIASVQATILPLPASVRAIALGPTPIHREIGALDPKISRSAAVAGLIECLQSAGVAR